jgi:hypothetical protein
VSHSPATTTTLDSHAAATSQDFGHAEVESFGRDDGQAISVIGKMLVGFFFYSLIIMAGVAIWTLRHGGQPTQHDASGAHAAPVEDLDD